MLVFYRSFTRVLIPLLAGLLLAWGIVPALAATTTVSDDSTLRTALSNPAITAITIEVGSTIQLLSNLPNMSRTLTINGNGATIQGGTNIRIFTIDAGANVTINNLMMTGGNCGSTCPAQNDSGGGIYNKGTLTVKSSTLSGNFAANGGGGIFNETGVMTITNSTLSDNSARDGAGIYSFNSAGTVTITNSTLSGNLAIDSGGGIYSFNSTGTVTITNSTLSSNWASIGGGIFDNSNTVILNNTLLGNSLSGENCGGIDPLSNGAAYNLADDGSCGAGVMDTTTASLSLNLGTLGANGGLTQTIPLLAGSAAIDAALAADCPATDQRGFVRPAGAGCDIGALEYGAVPPAAPTVPEFTAVPAPALCSLPGFPASTQVAVYLPNGNNGLNVCYSLISDPVQVGVTDQPFLLAAEAYTFDASGSVTTALPIRVCLQGAGTLLFRSATGQPRTTVSLPSFSQGGFTCGLIPNAGTVILVPGAAFPAAAIPPTALSACRVTTTNILNLRAEPGVSSAVLDHVPYQMTLSASARSGDWLQVVYGSQQGWLSAAYLTFEGGCG